MLSVCGPGSCQISGPALGVGFAGSFLHQWQCVRLKMERRFFVVKLTVIALTTEELTAAFPLPSRPVQPALLSMAYQGNVCCQSQQFLKPEM